MEAKHKIRKKGEEMSRINKIIERGEQREANGGRGEAKETLKQ